MKIGKTTRNCFVFDFDSTFTQVEALEELADISLRRDPQRQAKLAEIRQLTRRAMAGELSFVDSLERRLAMLDATQHHLDELVDRLRHLVSPSITRNRHFFDRHRDVIYIITGGFREFVEPVVTAFGIRPDHIFANRLRFDSAGRISGFDRANPLAQAGGKASQLQALRLPGMIHIIGDGYTDYEMKEAGGAHRFYAFTENVRREQVVRRADHVVASLDEFVAILGQSMDQTANGTRVLLLENIHATAVETLERDGLVVETVPGSLATAELAARLEGIDVLGIRSRTRITDEVLRSASALQAIGVFCIGTTQVDLRACSLHGVAVFNAPYSNTRSVAELVLGEIIVLERRIFERSTQLHAGIWQKTAAGSHEIRGKTLGIVGYGNIGSQVSVLAESLGMDVCYYDIVDKLAHGNARRCVSLHDLLRRSDVVTVHVDDSPGSHGLLGEEEFAAMKDGAVLLNLSRGFVVDMAALARALEGGRLRGAAVDVFPVEPESSDTSFDSELRGIPHVILTPHIGGSTEEAQEDIGHYVPAKLLDYLTTGSSYGSANFPLVRLDRLRDAHRCIHIHHNVPGVLAAIGQIFAEHEINIAAQHLGTNAEIGYVVTDVNSRITSELTAELRAVSNTIRFRAITRS